MEDSATPAAAITNIDILDTDVYTALASLDPSKSSGIDEIGPNILKHGVQALYISLHHLYKLYYSHCSIPSQWKIHQLLQFTKLVTDRMSTRKAVI